MDLIVNFTPTGMLPMKNQTPHVPISTKEIVADIRAAYSLGVTMVHLHARGRDGTPTCDKNIYAEIIGNIRVEMAVEKCYGRRGG